MWRGPRVRIHSFAAEDGSVPLPRALLRRRLHFGCVSPPALREDAHPAHERRLRGRPQTERQGHAPRFQERSLWALNKKRRNNRLCKAEELCRPTQDHAEAGFKMDRVMYTISAGQKTFCCSSTWKMHFLSLCLNKWCENSNRRVVRKAFLFKICGFSWCWKPLKKKKLFLNYF